MREIKYIIVRDKVTNHLRHFKSEYSHHYSIAVDNGFESHEIIEAGLFLDNKLYILEVVDLEHLNKRADRFVGNRLNFYQDLRLASWLRARELESQLYYSKKPIGVLSEGD